MPSPGSQPPAPNSFSEGAAPDAAPAAALDRFELPIQLPDNKVSCKAFMNENVAALRKSAVDGAFAVMEEALKTDAWKGLDFTARLTLEMTLQMAAEELVVNSMYYGVLQMDPENKVALCNRGSLDYRVQREAEPEKLEPEVVKARADSLWVGAVRELHEALRNPENRERSGKFSVTTEGDAIVVSIVDSGKFPRFHEVIKEARAKLDDPTNHPHGRGLVIACDMFDSFAQDPASGTLTFKISKAGIEQRAEQSRLDYEDMKRRSAEDIAKIEAAKKAG